MGKFTITLTVPGIKRPLGSYVEQLTGSSPSAEMEHPKEPQGWDTDLYGEGTATDDRLAEAAELQPEEVQAWGILLRRYLGGSGEAIHVRVLQGSPREAH